MRLNTHLNFDGQCEAAFRFYASCLEGRIVAMLTYGESPLAAQTPPEHHGRVLHATLELGAARLTGADVAPGMYQRPQGFSTLLACPGKDAPRIFTALADGGRVEMALQKTFWTSHFGVVVDRFGTPWLVSAE